MERAGWKPNDDHHQISPNCPRCGCSNTKFCYYNNYSLTQPRFFCKGCRRYWTKGGSLRNVPVGGGCRKNRRSSKSLRLPTTTTEGQAHHSNRSTNSGSYGGLHVQNSYGTNVIMNNPLGDSTSSSAIHQDGSSIDLALVYANFLNQKPENSNSTGSDDHQLPELPSEFDPAALDFSSMALNKNNGAGSGNNTSINQLMEDHHPNGLLGSLGVGCHSTLSHNLSAENCGANDHMFFGGLDPLIHHHHEKPQDKADRQVELYASSTHEESVFGLPPLPGQEALWSSSMQLQATVPLVGPEADHDPNLLIGSSWSPFDLPCNETFSRT